MEQLRHEEQELLYCMMLDGHNHLSGEQLLSRGTVNATLITPREVFVEALKYRAVNLILVHNHPGGDPSPSQADLDVTERIYHCGELLGIISSSVITGMSVSAKKGFLMNILK